MLKAWGKYMISPERKILLTVLVVVMSASLFVACKKQVAVQEPEPAVAAQKQQPAVQQEMKVEKELPYYERTIEPLSPEACAGCHFPIFSAIKESGGKHQIICTECHLEFHSSKDYAEIMPKCIRCHQDDSGGPFHGKGEVLEACLACHQDPHTPLVIPMDAIYDACGDCHRDVRHELEQNPSMHSDALACADCHSEKHGYIPDCFACHANHSPEVAMESDACMSCHPVHSPKNIEYADDTSSKICAACHEAPYELLTGKDTKHSHLTCAQCHPKHAEIEPCSQCHGQPHSSAMMQDMAKCKSCHGHAHRLTS